MASLHFLGYIILLLVRIVLAVVIIDTSYDGDAEADAFGVYMIAEVIWFAIKWVR